MSNTMLKHVQDNDNDEIPLLDDVFWNNAQMGSPLRKRLMSLRLDNDLVDWFKNRGPNYQTRMNQVLRTYMESCKREEIRC
jgi:uncharacterized protein (DUF4415 family)